MPLEDMWSFYTHFCLSSNSPIEKSYSGYAASLGMRTDPVENEAAASQISVQS
jgi:hypothetical protein